MAREDNPPGRRMNIDDVETFSEFKEWIGQKYQQHKGKVKLAGLAAALLVLGPKSCYTVPKGSQAVVQRFGAYAEKTNPGGPYFKIAFVDEVTKVDVSKIQKEEFGYRTAKADVRSEYIDVKNLDQQSQKDLERIVQEQNDLGYSIPEGDVKYKVAKLLQAEYLKLTGDLNMVDVEATIQYHVCDPAKYLFNLQHSKKTLRDIGEAEFGLVIGDRSIDNILTIGRGSVEQQVKERLQKVLDFYETGLCIDQINIQSVNPPDTVQPVFNDVNGAKQEKERLINNAWTDYNTVIPEAHGDSARIVQEAKADSTNRVNFALGDVSRFEEVLIQYRSAPEITRKRMYLEMWKELLPRLQNPSIIEQKGAEGGVLQTLKIDKK